MVIIDSHEMIDSNIIKKVAVTSDAPPAGDGGA